MDSKTVIAILVLIGSFGLLAPYVIRNEAPPDVILLIASAAISGVLAYYFGAHNGNITGLAAAATQVSGMATLLANQAIEKRAPSGAVVPVPVAGIPPSPTSSG